MTYDIPWAGRVLARAGLVVGSGGNLSVRRPDSETCLISRAGGWLDDLTEDDLSVVRIADGAALAGHPQPSSEMSLHLHAYRARPTAAAVVHVHPQASVLLTALEREIQLSTTDHVYYVGAVAQVPFLPPGSEAVARAAVEKMTVDAADCAILDRHGCVVLAESLELAVKRALNLEEAATTTYRALLLGRSLPPVPPSLREWAKKVESA
jgi:ribulose-5-phosphate 4-epimerase/fuculose-1-phosphate aldolase